ncbi:hypothetical protein HRG_005351 [Hirsutella rhossiliensis]|uniref:LysM domain-containing protein n=1 Tax=Hirsutella rhossiliensis TaxID=111463 RepID=A0A9P8SJA0_9HYPO|nr:uncharacterized protein HRG_05351 [Hirsutella rhossiliensis]KAH0962841.1 hypothetical protein HRG_05351 [Hirsutella rhossiliensis]
MVSSKSALLLLGCTYAASGALLDPRDAKPRPLGGIEERQVPSPVVETPTAVVTPQPALPSMVKNCDRFHLVKPGDTCRQVAVRYGLTTDQYMGWNPSAGPECTTLWAGYYSCVGVRPKPPGPVQRPQPTQPTIAPNCNQFHLVRAGETCNHIGAQYGIPPDNIIAWNPSAGPDCTTLWAGYYACVGVDKGSSRH